MSHGHHASAESRLPRSDSSWTLRVVAGIHSGARLSLAVGVHVIGRSEACDLVLADEGVAPEQVLVVVGQHRLMVRALAAGASLAGHPLEPDRLRRLLPGEALRVGGAVLLIEGVGRVRPARAVLGASAAVLIATAAWALSGPSSAIGKVAALPPLEHAAAVVGELRLAEVRVAEHDGVIRVEGYAPSASQVHALRRRLDAASVRVRVFAVDELLRFASDWLREQGIDAVANYRGDGRLEIGGIDTDPPSLDRRVVRLANDLPGLRELIVTAESPPPREPVAHAPAASAPTPIPLPRHALQGVTSLNAAHAVPYLSHGRHYIFAGGTLRNGMTVQHIGAERVTLRDAHDRSVLDVPVP